MYLICRLSCANPGTKADQKTSTAVPNISDQATFISSPTTSRHMMTPPSYHFPETATYSQREVTSPFITHYHQCPLDDVSAQAQLMLSRVPFAPVSFNDQLMPNTQSLTRPEMESDAVTFHSSPGLHRPWNQSSQLTDHCQLSLTMSHAHEPTNSPVHRSHSPVSLSPSFFQGNQMTSTPLFDDDSSFDSWDDKNADYLSLWK